MNRKNKIDPFPNVKIYYVLCPPFHGATLLSSLLNNHSQVTSLGDTFPNRKFDQTCSCQKKVSICDFWQRLYRETTLRRFSEKDTWIPHYPELVKNHNRNTVFINKIANALLLSLAIPLGGRAWRLKYQSFKAYYETYVQFVNWIAKKNETRVFIDGSKQLFKPFFMQSYSYGRIPARVIHIVRNPIDFSYIHYKAQISQKKATEEARSMLIKRGAKFWLTNHKKILRLKKYFLSDNSYIRISYEDLCADPKGCLRTLLEFIGIDNENLQRPVVYPNKFHLIGHITLFNFDGQVRPPRQRYSKLSDHEVKSIMNITKPFLGKLDYVLRASPEGESENPILRRQKL